MAGVNRRRRPTGGETLNWHRYIQATKVDTPLFRNAMRNSANICINRLWAATKTGKSLSQAVEDRIAELEAADGA